MLIVPGCGSCLWNEAKVSTSTMLTGRAHAGKYPTCAELTVCTIFSSYAIYDSYILIVNSVNLRGQIAIGFVPASTTDTCLSTLITGGASYYNSAYVVASGGVKAVPYFDANPAGGSNCDGKGDGSGCKFDVTGSAQAASVYVNNSSGEIDLQKTLNGQGNKGGLFGANPVDGQSVTVTIYYQLKHGSNNALQHIDVQFMYYGSASSIPTTLMNSLNTKLSNTLNGLLISTSANPRPPLVIITRRL